MAPRKSHPKSRKGCRTCKRRRVKCDETGPPCSNCASRNTECSYELDTPTCSRNSDSSPANNELTAPNIASLPTRSSSSTHLSASGNTPLIRSPLSATPSQPYTPPLTRPGDKLFELELMHRYTSSTWKSVRNTTLPEEKIIFQSSVPRDALKYDFLLNAIFALTSLDLAAETKQQDQITTQKYAYAALAYYDLAMSGLIKKVTSITSEDYSAMYMSATCMPILNVALHEYGPASYKPEEDIVATMVTVFELYNGSMHVIRENEKWTEEASKEWKKTLGRVVRIALTVYSPLILDEGTRAAIARMRAINDKLHEAPVAALEGSGSVPIGKEGYATAITNLEQQFCVENHEKDIKGYCISFPSFAGPNFAKAFAEGKPLALFIVMHWAVLLDWHSKKTWWVGQAGKKLVAELSERLSRLEIGQTKEWQDGFEWTREKVGLPGLQRVQAENEMDVDD